MITQRTSDAWTAQKSEVALLLLSYSSALELNPTKAGYISLQVAPTGIKNAITISSKPFKIAVLLRDEELITRLKSKFKTELVAEPRTASFKGLQYGVFEASKASIMETEELFRKIVAESVELTLELRKGLKHG